MLESPYSSAKILYCFNLDFSTKWVVCGFDKIVDLHHIDLDHQNNSKDNLVGICPNHHKMIHHRGFMEGVFELLKEKGFETPRTYKDDEFYKN